MSKTKLMRTVVDCATNEVTEREFTAEEYAQYEADQNAQIAKQAEAQAKAQLKTELLGRLGITEDEAKLLLG
jgi:hypothetical protein